MPMVVVEQKKKESQRAAIFPGKAAVKKKNEGDPTTADLVLLSLLAEQPMHGYQANRELERREIRDWAAISRPQVYYSMEKLARRGFLYPVESAAAPGGPKKQSFAASKRGRAALAGALEAEDWS